MTGRDRSYDSGEASHRALRGIRQALNRHPAVDEARGFPPATHSRVIAQLDAQHYENGDSDPTITIRWFAGETTESRPEFSFHYSDEGPGDFGWHHEPNPHVDGWGHFQERSTADADYDYSPHDFSSTNPTRIVWEIMSLLDDRLSD